MKRTYISPEYSYSMVNGTLNMTEHNTFFGSKMIEIPNNILIDNKNISYYENSNHEQINYRNESIGTPIVIDIANFKNVHHKIYRDISVKDSGGSASWTIEIALYDILVEYIFGNIKRIRSFESVVSKSLLNGDVDLTIKDYIGLNIVDKYDLGKIDFYVLYNDLSLSGGYVGENIYDTTIIGEVKNIDNIVFNSDKSIVKIHFKQSLDFAKYSFRYYFNLNYNKI